LPFSLGKVLLVASTTSYGVTKADTVEMTVQYALHASVTASNDWETNAVVFMQDAIVIGVGGQVTWYNYTPANVAITFDDTTNVTGGNVAAIGSYGSDSRVFPVAGTYSYKDTASGATGRVIVREQPTF
jgi:plastocyanin